MSDSSASYIHLVNQNINGVLTIYSSLCDVHSSIKELVVQHLIEKCLIFQMTKEECMEALSKHANINPVIAATVWKELEKENKEFFEEYAQSQNKDRMIEEETSAMIQKMIADSKQSDKVGSSKESDRII